MISANPGDKFAGNPGSAADATLESAELSAVRSGSAAAGAATGSNREKAPRQRIPTAPTASRAVELRDTHALIPMTTDARAAKVFKKPR
jgi:hypothetical protein